MPPPRTILYHMQVFCKKWSWKKEQINLFLEKYQKENIFWRWKKGHNSHNNGLILSYLELDLYFIIICLCVKFEFNTLMFLKDIKLKLFFNIDKEL